MPTRLQHLDRAPLRLLLRVVAVGAQALGELPADGVDGVERGRRLLEDHRRAGSAQRAALLGLEREHVGAGQHDGAPRHRRLRQQPEDRARRHGLAAARLADDREHLAGAHVERDVAHGEHVAAVGREGDVEVADLHGDVVARRGLAGHGRVRHRIGTSPSASRETGWLAATASAGVWSLPARRRARRRGSARSLRLSPMRVMPSTISTIAMPG